MTIGASAPVSPVRSRWSRRRRLLAASVTVALAVVLAVLGAGFVRGYVAPSWGGPAPDGPIVVLGGAPDRAPVGVALAEGPPPRELVLSTTAVDDAAELGRSCDEGTVHCLVPDPLDTFGEAQAVAQLSREHGWPAVTVVTSEFHLARSRMLFRRCLDVPVTMVGSQQHPDGRVPLGRASREALATAASWVVHRDC